MTTHLHRLVLLVPVNRVAAVVGWLQANVGVNSVPSDLGPGLSPTGADPATYRWCCASFTDLECREILKRLCQLASVTPLTNAQWNGSTGSQKRTWLASVRNAVWTGYGVWITLADNPGQWDNAQAVLAGRGLKTIASTP